MPPPPPLTHTPLSRSCLLYTASPQNLLISPSAFTADRLFRSSLLTRGCDLAAIRKGAYLDQRHQLLHVADGLGGEPRGQGDDRQLHVVVVLHPSVLDLRRHERLGQGTAGGLGPAMRRAGGPKPIRLADEGLRLSGGFPKGLSGVWTKTHGRGRRLLTGQVELLAKVWCGVVVSCRLRNAGRARCLLVWVGCICAIPPKMN